MSAWRQSVILRRPGSPGRRRISPWPFAVPNDRTARFFAALRMTAVGRGVPRQSRVGAKSPGRAPAYVVLALLLASPAFGQGVDVAASLDITDGWARVGAYVPVTLKVTNRTDKEIAEVFVTTGGPVDTRVVFHLAPGEAREGNPPVFYVGGQIRMHCRFFDSDGKVIAFTRSPVLEVKPLAEEAALLWIRENVPEPDEAERQALKQRLGAQQLHVRQLRNELDRRMDLQVYGLVDAVCVSSPDSQEDSLVVPVLPPVPGARTMVQPGAYALFASDSLRADAYLWLLLGLFTGAVLVLGVFMGHRWRVLRVLGFLALAGAGTTAIWLGGGIREARLHEWRLLLRRPSDQAVYAEHFLMLESRGDAPAGFYWDGGAGETFPLPLVALSNEAFSPFGIIYGDHTRENPHPDALFRARRPRCLLHAFSRSDERRTDYALEGPLPRQLAALSLRPDVAATLLVEGPRVTDASGRSQVLDAWAVEWQENTNPEVAWAGRSLKWWDRHRRDGDGPFLLAWLRDPAPTEPPPGVDVHERLPTLVVTSEAPTP